MPPVVVSALVVLLTALLYQYVSHDPPVEVQKILDAYNYEHDRYEYFVVQFQVPETEEKEFTDDSLTAYFHQQARQLEHGTVDLELVGQVGQINGHYLYCRHREPLKLFETPRNIVLQHFLRRIPTREIDVTQWPSELKHVAKIKLAVLQTPAKRVKRQ